MTTRKSDLHLSRRVRSYVSRESAAAELEISTETWDAWVKDGRVPPPAPGFPTSTPRWRWQDVDAKLAGKGDVAGDAFVAGAANMRNGAKKGQRRVAS